MRRRRGAPNGGKCPICGEKYSAPYQICRYKHEGRYYYLRPVREER